jgi:hypothetical protein
MASSPAASDGVSPFRRGVGTYYPDLESVTLEVSGPRACGEEQRAWRRCVTVTFGRLNCGTGSGWGWLESSPTLP